MELTTALEADVVDAGVFVSLCASTEYAYESAEELRWRATRPEAQQAPVARESQQPQPRTSLFEWPSRDEELKRTPEEVMLHSWLCGILNEPHWRETTWCDVVKQDELLASFAAMYVATRVKNAVQRCLRLTSDVSVDHRKTRIPSAHWQAIQSSLPLTWWFTSLCSVDEDGDEQLMSIRRLYPSHYEVTSFSDEADGYNNGLSLSFMQIYSEHSVEELRYQRLRPAADDKTQTPILHNPYSTLVWLVVHVRVSIALSRASQNKNATESDVLGLCQSLCDLVETTCQSEALNVVLMRPANRWETKEEFESAVFQSLHMTQELTSYGVRKEIIELVAAIQRDIHDTRDRVRGIVNTKSNIDGPVLETATNDHSVTLDVEIAFTRHCDAVSARVARYFPPEQLIRPLVDPSKFLSRYIKTHCLQLFSVPRAQTTDDMFARLDGLVGCKSDGFVRSYGESYPPTMSDHFDQWIPTDVRIRHDGRVELLSYINNLNPYRDRPLYLLIAQIFESMVPLFEHVLTQLTGFTPNPVFPLANPPIHSDKTTRNSTPNSFQLRGRVVQVVVSIVEVEVNNARLPNEDWHGDGDWTNRVFATGVYVLETDNLTPPELAFRRSSAYGFRGHCHSVYDEDMGSIVCHQGRCMVYPSYYQHKIGRLVLENPQKPGRLRLLAIYLVDPYDVLRSSAEIPPQETSWLSDATIPLIAEFYRLPPEVQPILSELLDSEAKTHITAMQNRSKAGYWTCYHRLR